MKEVKWIKKYDYGKNIVNLDEYVVSLTTFCNLGCEYCYLNVMKSKKIPLIQNNLKIILPYLERIFNSDIPSIYFNAGETSDSLLTESHINILEQLIKILSEFAEKYKKRTFLEIRTKTKNIYKIKSLKFSEKLKIIYSISIMPEEIKKVFEMYTSSVKERIETLNYAEKIGFLIGIRFEPIIIYPVKVISYQGIKSSIQELICKYKNLIDFLKKNLNLEKLHSISISTLRLTKQQFKILKEKKSKLCFPEMIVCPDGKYRYSRPIRITLYRKIIEILISSFGRDIKSKIFLATEFPYIWKDCGLEIKKLIDFYLNYEVKKL